jgi:hypothetical protein
MVKKTIKKSSAVKKGLKKFTLAPARTPNTNDDVKTAVLLVSVTLNLAFFVGWLALKLTDTYDAQVANFLFNR